MLNLAYRFELISLLVTFVADLYDLFGVLVRVLFMLQPSKGCLLSAIIANSKGCLLAETQPQRGAFVCCNTAPKRMSFIVYFSAPDRVRLLLQNSPVSGHLLAAKQPQMGCVCLLIFPYQRVCLVLHLTAFKGAFTSAYFQPQEGYWLFVLPPTKAAPKGCVLLLKSALKWVITCLIFCIQMGHYMLKFSANSLLIWN